MRFTFILPALTEATSPFWRPIKYALFPPLGLATLAGFLDERDQARIVDEHVERVPSDDHPDVVVIQVYVTNAYRAYALASAYRAKGVHVCLGGLHVTSLPAEAAAYADTIFTGPGEDTFPRFLDDLRRGAPAARYDSTTRSLVGAPRPRHDLLRRDRYLVPNSIVVSRGCPHHCDFCYKDAFFKGGKSFYTEAVDAALSEIETLNGRHLYFLDDHLLADRRFAASLFDGMRGMGRVFQGAATVQSVLRGDLVEKAAAAGLRSLFVGFETTSAANLVASNKHHNLAADYHAAIRRLDELGVMVNGSFVFGLDHDTPDVFDRTVDWAIAEGITTATFHILTPYPGTRLFERMARDGRLLHRHWPKYDTRHTVFAPRNGMTPSELEDGYWRAYDRFYSWGGILRGAAAHPSWAQRAKHAAYAVGWKKLEPAWDAVIRLRQLDQATPVLERLLAAFRTSHTPATTTASSIASAAASDMRAAE